jgi:hypothetical protein
MHQQWRPFRVFCYSCRWQNYNNIMLRFASRAVSITFVVCGVSLYITTRSRWMANLLPIGEKQRSCDLHSLTQQRDIITLLTRRRYHHYQLVISSSRFDQLMVLNQPQNKRPIKPKSRFDQRTLLHLQMPQTMSLSRKLSYPSRLKDAVNQKRRICSSHRLA